MTITPYSMLSKSLGQTLQVTASPPLTVWYSYVLFHLLSDTLQESLPDVISEQAVIAAIDFVEVRSQQTAYIAGRGDIEKEIKAGAYIFVGLGMYEQMYVCMHV